MNNYFFIAGVLCICLGIVHSILGEYLIFNDKRDHGKLVPTKSNTDLKERHLRIIWATWHLATVLGWCIGALLITIALEQNQVSSELKQTLITIITCGMVGSSILVLFGTKGKHPGWIVFLVIAILLILGR